MNTQKSITIKLTANSITELLELIDHVAEDISARESLQQIADYDISIQDLTKMEYCFDDCELDKTHCSCHQEELGCMKYHREKEDALMFDLGNTRDEKFIRNLTCPYEWLKLNLIK